MADITPGLERLRRFLHDDPDMTISKVVDYVEKAAITEEDLLPFADFDHPVEDGYGRKLAVGEDHFEIMVMSWKPGDFSAVHDHGYTTWGAVQVFGNVMHHSFVNKDDVFQLSSKEILPYGTIIKVNNPLIHQMGNVTTKPYMTLHIYGDNEYVGDVTTDSKIYELENNLIKETTGGAFFNLPDDKVYNIKHMGEIDYDTLIHQASILMQYYQRFDHDKARDLSKHLMTRLSYCMT
ncbi:MAG: cysteine dioxygenase family protein [Bacteroidota bacterium]